MKRKIIISIVVCTLLLFVACAQEDTTLQDAASYSWRMGFHTNTGFEHLSLINLESIGYNQIIFVYSEEDFLAGEFPDEAIVAWPSLVAYLTLEGMNIWIRENEKQEYVATYSLEYPLTIVDAVDNWKDIRNLDISIRVQTNERYPNRYAVDELGRILSFELDTLSAAFEAAGIDVTEHGFQYPLRSWQIHRVLFELYDKLDEDVQLRLLTEIPNLMALYRAELREIEWSERRHAEREVYGNAE